MKTAVMKTIKLILSMKNENIYTLIFSGVFSILLILFSFYVINQRLEPINILIAEMQQSVERLELNTSELEIEISEAFKQMGLDLLEVNSRLIEHHIGSTAASDDLQKTINELEIEIKQLEENNKFKVDQ